MWGGGRTPAHEVRPRVGDAVESAAALDDGHGSGVYTEDASDPGRLVRHAAPPRAGGEAGRGLLGQGRRISRHNAVEQ